MRAACVIVGVMLLLILIAPTLKTNFAAAGESDNLCENPGAEEVNPAGEPIGWGHYVGAGTSEWGTTTKEAHSGRRSAFLTVTGYHNEPPQYVNWVNHGLMVGDTNGYSGEKAFDMEPDKEYYYAFWIKAKDPADFKVPCIHVFLQCWAGGTSSKNRVRSDEIKGSPIKPTAEWKLYTGKVKTPPGTIKGSLMFHITGNNGPCKLGATFYVDDVYLGLTPPPENIVGQLSISSKGKLVTIWGCIKDK